MQQTKIVEGKFEMIKRVPFYVCGAHCSGKTSILKDLYQEGVISERGSEIGKDIYYQRGIDTASQGEKFEIEITEMEVARDKEYMEKEGVIGIESWHPGNLAYAMVRNPSIVPKLIQRMKKSPLLSCSYGIHLCVSRENIYSRTKTFYENPEWAADFYTRIEKSLEEALKSLNLFEKCFIINSDRSYCDVYSDVKILIKKICDL